MIAAVLGVDSAGSDRAERPLPTPTTALPWARAATRQTLVGSFSSYGQSTTQQAYLLIYLLVF